MSDNHPDPPDHREGHEHSEDHGEVFKQDDLELPPSSELSPKPSEDLPKLEKPHTNPEPPLELSVNAQSPKESSSIPKSSRKWSLTALPSEPVEVLQRKASEPEKKNDLSPGGPKKMSVSSLTKVESLKPDSTKSSPRASQSSSGSPPTPKPGKYTSIDLENELPEIFSSSLNPAIQDPDMSEFFSRAHPRFKPKSPPPIYISRKASAMLNLHAHPRKSIKSPNLEKQTRRIKFWLAFFVFVFFILPIGIVLVFHVIPDLLTSLDEEE